MNVRSTVEAILIIAALMVSICMMWSYLVPVNILYTEGPGTIVYVEYMDDEYPIEIPDDYIQLPTVRWGLPIRMCEYAKEDPVAEQVAAVLMTDCDGQDTFYKTLSVLGFLEDNVEYKNDPGPTDHWKLPWETVRDGCGDCEDIAILSKSVLNYMGVECELACEWDHVLLIVNTGYKDFGMEYKGGYWEFFDPTVRCFPGQCDADVIFVSDEKFGIWGILEFTLYALGAYAILYYAVDYLIKRRKER